MDKSLVYKILKYIAGYFINIFRYHCSYFLFASDYIQGVYLDRKLHICTSQCRNFEDGISVYGDGNNYMPTPYRILKKITRFLNLSSQDIFVDLGSGCGRAVFYVASQTVRKTIGVELNPEWIDLARRNLENFKLKHSLIEFINIDAALFRVKNENVFYFYNAFGRETLKQVTANIKKSLIDYPRKIRIVYYVPVYRSFLERQDWLVLEKKIAGGDCLIWGNRI